MRLFDINGVEIPSVGQRVEWYSKRYKSLFRGRIRKVTITKDNIKFSVWRDKVEKLFPSERWKYNFESKKYESYTKMVPLGQTTVVLSNYKTMKVL